MSATAAETRAPCPDPQTLRKLLCDDLAPEDAGRVEEHVGACPGCQRVLQRLVGSMPDTVVGPTPEPPAGGADDEVPPNLPGYEPLGRIDAGGMGVVWRVRDLQFGRSLAVKVMKSWACASPGLVGRFVGEAQICGQLAHPYIVPIHTMGRLPDGRPYYAMKLVEGRTLAALLEGGPAPAERRMGLVQVFGQLCQAVAFAHSKGIIHRDLKPDNVMVGAHGEVQLMDWGLAKVLGDARSGEEPRAAGPGDEDAARTHAGSVLGTPAYMPPEQARGEVEAVDQRSDVFSLGAVLCQVLSGQPPYADTDVKAAHRRAREADLGDPLARLRGCGADPELIRLAERCLAPGKAVRPADAGEVAAAVAAYLAGAEERLQQERLRREREEVQRAEQRRRRKLWLGLAAAVLAALGLAAGGGLYWQGQRSQRHQEAAQALDAAEGQLRAGEFPAARESLTRAADRLREAPPAGLAGRRHALQAAWQLVQDLEQIERRRTTPTDEGMFDNETAQKSYQETFAAAGYDLTDGDPSEVAGRIRRSLVMTPILEAIDNWALVCEYDIRYGSRPKEEYRRRRDRLLEVARAVDPHPEFRDKVRDPHVWDDRRQLEELAGRAQQADLSPRLAALLAEVLRAAGGDQEQLLRAFQRRYPGDFWLNFDLAKRLDATDTAEALKYYQAALAVRPHHAIVMTHIGTTLGARRDWEEAVAHFERALALADEADSIGLRNNLADVLLDKGDFQGAEALYRENVGLRPGAVRTNSNLGAVLLKQGKFAEGLESLRRAQQLAVEQDSFFRPYAEHNVRLAERLLEADRRLAAGKAEPADADESLTFADVCFWKRRYADAVPFYRQAFARDPRLAQDLGDEHSTGNRSGAARAAALAADGQGEGADALGAPRRAELRQQALTWLRQDLDAWGQRAAEPTGRTSAQAALRLWQRHPHLAGVRDPAALARLPAEERRAWEQFWADVAVLLGRVRGGG
jgi:serine/threonine-protein kinase